MLGKFLRRPITCGRAEDFAIIQEKRRDIGLAQPRGVGKDRLIHRLQLDGRVRNNVEHLAGRRLLLQRFGQLTIPGLEFLKQPHVLNCDHRLVSESRHELDLLVSKRASLLAPHSNNPNGALPL